LPIFYLKGFCRDGKLCVFDKKENRYNSQSPINTAVIKNYYTILDKSGKESADIETNFFAWLEGLTKPILDKVEGNNPLSDNERYILSVFVSFLLVRVPSFEEQSDDFVGSIAKKMLLIQRDIDMQKKSENSKENGSDLNLAIEDDNFYRLLDEGKIAINLNKNHRLKWMLESGNYAAKYLFQMDWMFLHAPKRSSFITSDNPFILIPPAKSKKHFLFRNVGIATPGALKCIPLCKNVCILIGQTGNRISHILLTQEQVRNFNLLVARSFRRFLIARDKILLKSIVGYFDFDNKDKNSKRK